MAPTNLLQHTAIKVVRHISHSLAHLSTRATSTAPSLASIFAVIVRETTGSPKRSITSLPLLTRKPSPNTDLSDLLNPTPLHPLSKRQTYILCIPTTYDGLNSGPSPGAVVGIMLGSIAGFLFVLSLLFLVVRVYAGRTIVEREVIERRHVHRGHRSRSHSTHMSEPPLPPPSRRESRRATTIIEERRTERSVSRPREEEVIVEEEEDDVVEVIEEHSPERRESRRKSTRVSGYRTVDPAELGGGDRPMRKVSRRDSRM